METTPSSTAQPRKKRPVGAIVMLGIAALAALAYFTSHSGDYNLTLQLAAKTENLSYPKMVDDATRIDSVTASHDRIYHYYYSFPGMTSKDIPNEDFCGDWEAIVIEEMKKTDAAKEFGEHGVTLMFTMNDKTGAHLCTVTLPVEKYYKIPGN
jgi:hypothetical protein